MSNSLQRTSLGELGGYTPFSSTSLGELAFDLGIDLDVLEEHILRFSAASCSTRFNASCQSAKFSSMSGSITVSDTPTPLGFILKEDGANILNEDGPPIAQE